MINWLLDQEDRMGLGTPQPFRDFEERVFRHQNRSARYRALVGDGKKILGYGASTKGNVVLQFCGLHGSRNPGNRRREPRKSSGASRPERTFRSSPKRKREPCEPDYFLVLPWHFKDGILRREREYLATAGS